MDCKFHHKSMNFNIKTHLQNALDPLTTGSFVKHKILRGIKKIIKRYIAAKLTRRRRRSGAAARLAVFPWILVIVFAKSNKKFTL